MRSLQEEIIQEAKIMKQCHHENILSLHCSFVHQENLWMVMPYVKGGSVLNIMKYAFPKVRAAPHPHQTASRRVARMSCHSAAVMHVRMACASGSASGRSACVPPCWVGLRTVSVLALAGLWYGTSG